MSPATASHAEDQRVVAIEVAEHLEQLVSIEIVDPRQLAEVWLELRRCDGAALDVLQPDVRQAYLRIVGDRRGPHTMEVIGSATALRRANAQLLVAIHRRVMLLHLVARGRERLTP